MPFLSGRLTCLRYRVSGRTPRAFGPEHLDQLDAHHIGKQRLASADGVLAGWTAGDHILDTRFDLAKNIVNDALQFSLRIDSQAIPADLLRAYTQVEMEGLAAANPSGHASSRQKREARMLAKEKLDNEARDGRYLRRKATPLLWDAQSNELLVGTTSATVLDRLHTIFHQTFDRKLELLGSGRQAFLLAEATQQTRAVDDATPSAFVSTQTSEVAWTPDEHDRDFLGNEFLLWLWFYLESEGDSLALQDNSSVEFMLARTLTLECPRGQTGKESISSDGPTRLPEAHRAIQSGKLPRKMGVTMVRHGQAYELTLAAETLAISGARLPAPEGEEERARQEERISQVRAMLETLDLMYAAFVQRRLGADWTKEMARMKKWLQAT